jgi:photosystem II stability/assembly factor-like uncharacterized protein
MSYSVFVGASDWKAAEGDTTPQGLFGLDGDRWVALSAGLPADVQVRAVAVRPDRPSTVWAGTQHGPYRSTDGGVRWTAVPLPAGTPAEERVVWSLCFDPADADTVYCGTQGTTVFRSRDAGGTWAKLPITLPDGALVMSFPMRVVRVVVSPVDPDEIHVGLEVGGVVRSLDGGATWQTGNPSLLAHTSDDRYKSAIVTKDETEGMLDSHALAASGAHARHVWLANRMGLFLSDDAGLGWTDIHVGRFSPLTYARDVKASAHAPKRLYAALSVAASSDAGSLYRSDDIGESWARFDHGVDIDSTLMMVAESTASPDRVYAAARRGKVFGTEDGGATWRTLPLPATVKNVFSLATV